MGYLQDGFLILDMFDLLEPDHVVDGEDLEGEVFPTGPIPTQADTSKGACKNKKFTFNFFFFNYRFSISTQAAADLQRDKSVDSRMNTIDLLLELIYSTSHKTIVNDYGLVY